MFKVNNKNIRTTSMKSLWYFLLTLNIFYVFLEFVLDTMNKSMLAGMLNLIHNFQTRHFLR